MIYQTTGDESKKGQAVGGPVSTMAASTLTTHRPQLLLAPLSPQCPSLTPSLFLCGRAIFRSVLRHGRCVVGRGRALLIRPPVGGGDGGRAMSLRRQRGGALGAPVGPDERDGPRRPPLSTLPPPPPRGPLPHAPTSQTLPRDGAAISRHPPQSYAGICTSHRKALAPQPTRPTAVPVTPPPSLTHSEESPIDTLYPSSSKTNYPQRH
ncbi:hypothetical protein AAG570_010311 [Ranatra chinensis]|uniref:Uncharacterized protein n=1 Tax=Ranatra chinensis TaxID=642074 RepID=A0ABD0YME9_9HEMI